LTPTVTPTGEDFIVKFRRAEEHLQLLTSEIEAFLRSHPFHAVREVETGRTQFRIEIHQQPPPRLTAIVGDILQNARAVLDHLAWRLAGDNPPRTTYFPIYTSKVDYFSTDKNGKPASRSGRLKIAALAAKAQAVIEAMQPYHGHDLGRALGWLNDFARMDRHQAVHLLGGVGERPRIRAGRRDPLGNLVMSGASSGKLDLRLGAFDQDTVVASFTHPADVEVEVEFTFGLAMSDGRPDSLFYPLPETLKGVLHAIGAGVIPPLEPFFPPAAARIWSAEPMEWLDLGDAFVWRGPQLPGQPYVAEVNR